MLDIIKENIKVYRSHFMCFLLIFVALSDEVHAENFSNGTEYYRQGNYSAAYKSWLEYYENNPNGFVLFNLGFMVEKGLGTEKDIDKSIEWYLLAASLGHSGAQNNLGVLLYENRTDAESLQFAYSVLTLAAKSHNYKAFQNLAVLSSELSPNELDESKALLENCINTTLLECQPFSDHFKLASK